MSKITVFQGPETRTEVTVRSVAEALNHEQMAELLETYVNTGGGGRHQGEQIGAILQNSHRTLQRSVIALCLHVLKALGEQTYTDARNELAINTCTKIGELMDEGELPLRRC